MGLTGLVKSDFGRFTQTFELRDLPYSKTKVFLESLIFKAGFQAVLLYRLSHWLYTKGRIYPAWFLTRLNIAFTGAEIEFNAKIGPGLFIAHPVGVVIGRGALIGKNATIFQGVSLVVKSWRPDEIQSFPAIGDGCYLFANSMVIGGVSIGNRCVISAGSAVRDNMPDGALATGSPATIVPDKGSKIISEFNPGDPNVKSA